MSGNDSTPLSQSPAKPRLYTGHAAYRLTGIGFPTIKKYLAPDFELVSQKGDRVWPVWLESSLLEWAAKFRETYGATPQERSRYAPQIARDLSAQGGAR